MADEEMEPDEEDASSDDDESCSQANEQKQNKQLAQSSEQGMNKLLLFENFDYNRYKDGKNS